MQSVASPARRRRPWFYAVVLAAFVAFAVWDCRAWSGRLFELKPLVGLLVVTRVAIEVLASFYVFSLVLKSLLYPVNRLDQSLRAGAP